MISFLEFLPKIKVNLYKFNTYSLMKNLFFVLSILFLFIFSINANQIKTMETNGKLSMEGDSTTIAESEKLVVIWTSGDPEVAKKMVFMYTYNAKKYGWWEDITLVVWGPSAKLLTKDKELQESIIKMKEIGINLLASKGCSDQYDVSDDLENLGIEVKYIGVELTDFIKGDYHLVTF